MFCKGVSEKCFRHVVESFEVKKTKGIKLNLLKNTKKNVFVFILPMSLPSFLFCVALRESHFSGPLC